MTCLLSNLHPPSDPDTARAVLRFYESLICGRAVTREDKDAPPLDIERERDN